jgi:hypothetical protein
VVANHAYLSVWLRDASESNLLQDFQRFLATIPFSETRPGFTELVVRAIDPAESPLMERDLRAADVDAAAVAAMIAEQLHSDSSYEVGAWWDLWTFDISTAKWQLQPQPLLIICNGDEYDGGNAREVGNIQVDLGFEHFFTGHTGLLGDSALPSEAIDSSADFLTSTAPGSTEALESVFVATMAQEQHRKVYLGKTAGNIRALLDWSERVRAALDVKQFRLWSEGEENFEARLDEIMAAH